MERAGNQEAADRAISLVWHFYEATADCRNSQFSEIFGGFCVTLYIAAIEKLCAIASFSEGCPSGETAGF